MEQDFNGCIDSCISTTSSDFTDKDETHHLFDKHDKGEITSIVSSVCFLTLLYFFLKHGLKYEERDFQNKFVADLSVLVLFRSFIIEYIAVPFFSLSVSTMSTIMLQTKLAAGQRVTRGNTRGSAREYGYNPYETIGAYIFLPVWLRVIRVFGKKDFFRKIIYFFMSTVDKRQGMFQVYSSGDVQENLRNLEASLDTDDFKYFIVDRASTIIKGGLYGIIFIRNINRYNSRLKELQKCMKKSDHKLSSLQEFCKTVKKDDDLFRTLTSKDSTIRYCFFFKKKLHHRAEDFGLLYNRVRRSAGFILLKEREAARIINTRGRARNGIGALIILLIGIAVKTLIESAVNVTGNESFVDSTPAFFPYPKNTSASNNPWKCTRIYLQEIVFAPVEESTLDCLWTDSTLLKTVQVTKTSSSAYIKFNGTHWITDNEFVCQQQVVTSSMSRNTEKFAPGGFLQVCSNNRGSIMLILDKFDNSDNSLGTVRKVVIYKSEWLTSFVFNDVAETVGVQKINSLDFILLQSVRNVGVDKKLELFESERRKIKGILDKPEILYWIFGTLGVLLVISFLLKRICLTRSGKLNIRSDDLSMLSSYGVKLTGLPVCNVISSRLTPELRITSEDHGTKHIEFGCSNHERRALRSANKEFGLEHNETETEYDSEKRVQNNDKKDYDSNRIQNNYKDISWEEIQY